MVVETSLKNQYSYFYILNSFLKKAKKNNEVGLRYGVWGRAPAGVGEVEWWYISSAYQCLHLLVKYTPSFFLLRNLLIHISSLSFIYFALVK